jgi:hypothetical protein
MFASKFHTSALALCVALFLGFAPPVGAAIASTNGDAVSSTSQDPGQGQPKRKRQDDGGKKRRRARRAKRLRKVRKARKAAKKQGVPNPRVPGKKGAGLKGR